MQNKLLAIDWFFIVGYCVVAFGIGIYFARRAGQNIEQYFVAGRKLPWWLAGTSIVATSFATDTPLAVAGFIRKGGIYENWIWWNAVMGGMLCVFFYARLWRRAGIITDVEFIELRYEGTSASVLRGFLAVYSGVLTNCITMGWVMMAMARIFEVMLGWNSVRSLAVLVVLALVYTVLSGLWGVVVTDLIQFIMAMIGSVALAVIVMSKMGGPTEMVSKILAAPGIHPKVLNMVPDPSTSTSLALTTFVILVSALWWGGGQGGGIIAQRLFASRNEKHALLAAFWFNFAHYVLRPWPWIIVGLASLVFFPVLEGEQVEDIYPMMMNRFLPVGIRGLMVASFLAAFMSTMDSHLNWGSSYLVNDLYKRFIRKGASAGHYVLASRLACLFIVLLAAVTAWQIESIVNAWKYLVVLTSGFGFVALLRWFWWRVNAWAEISALIGSFVIANGNLWAKFAHRIGILAEFPRSIGRFYEPDLFAIRALVIIIVCTVIWVVVALLTPPVSEAHLERFYRRVRPGGWWGPIARKCGDVAHDGSVAIRWLAWLLGVLGIYAGLFGIGYICLGRVIWGVSYLGVGLLAGVGLKHTMKRIF